MLLPDDLVGELLVAPTRATHSQQREPILRPPFAVLITRGLGGDQHAAHCQERSGTFRGHRRGSERAGGHDLAAVPACHIPANLLRPGLEHLYSLLEGHLADDTSQVVAAPMVAVDERHVSSLEEDGQHQPWHPATRAQIDEPKLLLHVGAGEGWGRRPARPLDHADKARGMAQVQVDGPRTE